MSSRAGSAASDPTKKVDVTDPYPVQRHAGKVGYGPNYNISASISDRVTGIVEEVRGKITKNPELVRHGHAVFTGEEKRKHMLGQASRDDNDKRVNADKMKEPPSAIPVRSNPDTQRVGAGVAEKISTNNSKEQAAGVAPKSMLAMEQARVQKKGGAVEHVNKH
ncbi:hypothetical protein BDQ12DRAFT_713724 [Crucibulum laeve]|uniref:Uncharacterized protein n=1 Tax=Crucibulum laeve TaxID=68775 RepID=A0A5C3LV84_9AGAR|nr:hypothetical protein BDQ12DRAFT_713724 [Crucibulum laeve]